MQSKWQIYHRHVMQFRSKVKNFEIRVKAGYNLPFTSIFFLHLNAMISRLFIYKTSYDYILYSDMQKYWTHEILKDFFRK